MKKLDTQYPFNGYDNALAKFIAEKIETLPHEQRLYPDLFANSLSEAVTEFLNKNR